MEKALMILFFVSWMACGCLVDTMLDNYKSGAAALIVAAIAIACALRLSRGNRSKHKGE